MTFSVLNRTQLNYPRFFSETKRVAAFPFFTERANVTTSSFRWKQSINKVIFHLSLDFYSSWTTLLWPKKYLQKSNQQTRPNLDPVLRTKKPTWQNANHSDFSDHSDQWRSSDEDRSSLDTRIKRTGIAKIKPKTFLKTIDQLIFEGVMGDELIKKIHLRMSTETHCLPNFFAEDLYVASRLRLNNGNIKKNHPNHLQDTSMAIKAAYLIWP